MADAKEQTRFLITGGHMTPAFAVLDELQKRGYRKFVWVGHKYNQQGSHEPSAEFKIVSQMGIKFIDLKAGKLSRNFGDNFAGSLLNLLRIPLGFISSFFIIIRHRPQVILSFGGYLALPVAVVGKLLRKKVITHEQTAVTGLTNKIIPKFADKVLISWPSSAKYYPADKTILTGNPLRNEILQSNSNEFQFANSLPTLYITGGNQGSHKLNQSIFDNLPGLLKLCNVIHQTGNSTLTGDFAVGQKLKQGLADEVRDRYYPVDFVYADNIGEVFSKADLVVARSGANTTYEILALGKRAIFVPIPWVTHNEQFLNAKIAADTGLASILPEAELSAATMLSSIQRALGFVAQGQDFLARPLHEATSAAQELIVPNAASLIADEVEKCILN